MLLQGSSAARAGRLLQSVKGRAAYLESAQLAARSSFAAASAFNGRSLPSTASTTVVAVRSYADGAASRPKAHTGRATSTRKPRATTIKAAAGTAGRTTKKRTTTTTKAKAKPKAKPKPKPKRKAVLTPEAKQLREVRKLKAELLKPPKQLPATAFLVIAVEQSKTGGLAGKQAAAVYHNLSPSEREHYNHIANENRVKNKSAYTRWLHSHSATEVKRANEAGRRLVRLGARKRYTEVRDDRKPKRSCTARTFFIQDRFASGDMAGMPATEAMRLISAEWKQLSSSQQQKYLDLAKADRERYLTEYKRAYGS